jgi:hypothetical protein
MTRTLIHTPITKKFIFGLGLMATLLLWVPKSVDAVPLVITKTSFSLAFEDGYGLMPFMPVTDSAFNVVDSVAGDAFVMGRSHHSATPASAAIYLSIVTQTMIGQMVRTDSITMTLGGNVFTAVGYKETGVDADTSTRLRIYVTTKGNLMFIAQLIYNIEDGAGSVARLEEALKSLDIHSIAKIIAMSTKRGNGLSVSSFNIQGRACTPSLARTARIPMFSRH